MTEGECEYCGAGIPEDDGVCDDCVNEHGLLD